MPPFLTLSPSVARGWILGENVLKTKFKYQNLSMKHKFAISPNLLRLYLLELSKMGVIGVWQGKYKVVGT